MSATVMAEVCSNCKSSPAAIFQVDGDFCAECWQAITHPNIECRL